jgi:hypothetical protein
MGVRIRNVGRKSDGAPSGELLKPPSPASICRPCYRSTTLLKKRKLNPTCRKVWKATNEYSILNFHSPLGQTDLCEVSWINGRSVWRGGVLPPPTLPANQDQIKNISLTETLCYSAQRYFTQITSTIQSVSFNAGMDTEQPSVTSIAKQQRYCPLYGAQSSVKKTHHTIIHKLLWDNPSARCEPPMDQVRCQDGLPQLQTARRWSRVALVFSLRGT